MTAMDCALEQGWRMSQSQCRSPRRETLPSSMSVRMYRTKMEIALANELLAR